MHRRDPRFLAISICLGGSALAALPAAATDDGSVIALPLAIHAPGGALDAPREALLAGLAEAYAPHGICFVPSMHPLPEESRELRTIRERHALRALLVPRAANAFMVDRAFDPRPSASTRRTAARAGFEPSGLLGGAHIPAEGRHPATYVLVTRGGSSSALAHELGHFLGAGHHPDPTNIMSYGAHRDRFDAAQVRVFRARARRYVARGELTRVEQARCAAPLAAGGVRR